MAKTLISRDLLRHVLHEQIHHAYENGIQEGKQQGFQDGQQTGAAWVLQIVLEQRLGKLDADLQTQIAGLSFAQLCILARQLPQITTPAELFAWLEQA